MAVVTFKCFDVLAP